ncbi:MAG: GNAT family N-acetyltransferase [Hydrococcus sp. SU_1_0]|nr:GNAT family N-acetyltransferase [Hydrococcus sp. SU_1_0]
MKIQDIGIIDLIQKDAYRPDLWEGKNVIADKIQLYTDGCWVSEYNQKIVGYLISYPGNYNKPSPHNKISKIISNQSDCYFIHDIAVDSKKRDCGVGASLIKKAFQIAESQKFSVITLIAVQNTIFNSGVSYGFKKIENNSLESNKIIKSYGKDAVYMERKLISIN